MRPDEENFMPHRFKIGQTVKLTRDALRATHDGNFRIVALRPPEHGDPQYLIKSDEERCQRVVAQSAIRTEAA
jgi:hypothetical protein